MEIKIQLLSIINNHQSPIKGNGLKIKYIYKRIILKSNVKIFHKKKFVLDFYFDLLVFHPLDEKKTK